MTRTLPLLLLLAAILLGAGCTVPAPVPHDTGLPTPVPSIAPADSPPDACSFDQLTGGPGMNFLQGNSCYFQTHTPSDFLDDLRDHPGQPVMVLEVPAGWITLRDAGLLMREIDSGEPAAAVVSPLSSYWPFNQTSSVGNEALFLLEGYRSGKYPPALCSLYYFKPDRTQVQSWWDSYGKWGFIDDRDAIGLVRSTYPELQGYPSDGLPPRSIRTEHDQGGWYVAFIQEGSGLPILSARCYYVGNNRTVILTGMVNQSIMVLPEDFSPQRCGI
jgi:hypothetical protein